MIMDETEAGIGGVMSGKPKFGQRYRASVLFILWSFLKKIARHSTSPI